ncbi:MAG: cytochrome c [Acidobacteriota bacterium]
MKPIAKAIWMMGLAGALACGQGLTGEVVYARTCSSGYCHGSRGVGGGAPRLAARGFDQDYITSTIANGFPSAGMPAFGNSLSKPDLAAVASYIAKLNGVTIGAPVAVAPVKLTPQAEAGETLFRDAVKGFGRCSTCHLVGGYGISVAAPIQAVPMTVPALKTLATPRVISVTTGGETMPALIIARKAAEVTFYDMTVAPPVLRTAKPTAFVTAEGSAWKHENAIAAYDETELTAILAYLRLATR